MSKVPQHKPGSSSTRRIDPAKRMEELTKHFIRFSISPEPGDDDIVYKEKISESVTFVCRGDTVDTKTAKAAEYRRIINEAGDAILDFRNVGNAHGRDEFKATDKPTKDESVADKEKRVPSSQQHVSSVIHNTKGIHMEYDADCIASSNVANLDCGGSVCSCVDRMCSVCCGKVKGALESADIPITQSYHCSDLGQAKKLKCGHFGGERVESERVESDHVGSELFTGDVSRIHLSRTTSSMHHANQRGIPRCHKRPSDSAVIKTTQCVSCGTPIVQYIRDGVRETVEEILTPEELKYAALIKSIRMPGNSSTDNGLNGLLHPCCVLYGRVSVYQCYNHPSVLVNGGEFCKLCVDEQQHAMHVSSVLSRTMSLPMLPLTSDGSLVAPAATRTENKSVVKTHTKRFTDIVSRTSKELPKSMRSRFFNSWMKFGDKSDSAKKKV